jgi:hypothetical protein
VGLAHGARGNISCSVLPVSTLRDSQAKRHRTQSRPEQRPRGRCTAAARHDVVRLAPEGLHVDVPPDGVLVALARTAGRRGARSGPRRTHSVTTPPAGDPPSIALQFEEPAWNSPVRLRLDSCWLMQWIPPPPAAMSLTGTEPPAGLGTPTEPSRRRAQHRARRIRA